MSKHVPRLPQEEIDAIFKEWVAALRSGKYSQCKDVLRTAKNCYCCLGVLCEILVQRNHLAPPKLDERAGRYYYEEPNSRKEALSLPSQVVEMLGVTATVSNGEFSLAYLNDHGSSFEEIADVIEKDKARFLRYGCSTWFVY